MLPFSGSISVFSEYRTRKKPTHGCAETNRIADFNRPTQEAEGFTSLKAGYQQKILMIEQDYEHQRRKSLARLASATDAEQRPEYSPWKSSS